MPEKKSEKAEEGVKPKKKKPPLLLMIAVASVIALLVTFAVGKQVSARGRHGHKVIERGPVMILDEFLVNLADPGGEHFLKVTIGLELNKEKGKTPESLKEQIAPIRDAILMSLASKQRDEINNSEGRDKLKAEIKEKVNDALGEEDVENVYFTNFVTQ